MIERLNFTENNLDRQKANFDIRNVSDSDLGIFAEHAEAEMPLDVEENAQLLEEQLKAIQDKNGAILDTWDDLKCALNLGKNSEKCNESIEKYKQGEITFEKALEEINKFGAKQDGSLNLFSNIASSTASILAVTIGTALGVCAAPFTAGASLALTAAGVAIGAGSGAVAKSAFKTADRATNEVDDDALDGKQMAKDALSGAVTGAIACSTMNCGGGSTVKETLKATAKRGALTGAVSGSSNYLIDCAVEEDRDFKFTEFADSTVSNAAAGAAVGVIMGGINCVKNSASASTGTSNSLAKDVFDHSVTSAKYKIVNDKVRSAGAAVSEIL